MVDWAAHTARMIGRIGGEVTMHSSGVPERKVTAVFTSAVSSDIDVDTYIPMLRMTIADADGVSRGDWVTVGEKNYRISRIQADPDAGDVMLALQVADG
jgi:hypothetical protein